MKQKQMLITLLNGVMLCSILLGLFAPAAQLGIAQAQETTEEVVEPEVTETVAPQPEETIPPPTEETPVTPTEATEEPMPVEVTEEPQPEATEEAEQPEATEETTPEITPEATQPAPETTETVTPESTEPVTPTQETPPPDPTHFQDDFQDSDTVGWTLSPGWKIASIGDTLALTAVTPNETATIDNIVWPHLLMAVRMRIAPGSVAELDVRGTAFTIALDAFGQATLYRDDTMLAQGPLPPPVEGDPVAVWRTLNVQALGSKLTVGVDGVVQFAYDDVEPAASGSMTFRTHEDNTGSVSLDDLSVNKLDAPVPAPEETPAPEVTEVVEVTAEATAEATSEATAEATPEATAEVENLVALEILSADFESEPTNWVLGDGSVIVAESDSNHALLVNSGGSLVSAIELDLSDLRLDARFNILTDAPTGLSVVFRAQEAGSYVLSIEATQTALFASDGSGLNLLASSPTTHDLNAWHTLRVEAIRERIVVTIDDIVELDHSETEPLVGGSFALLANGDTSFFLDDIVVSELIPADELTEPTPLPVYTLTEENGQKLSSQLLKVLELYEAGDIAGALELATASNIDLLDDALNLDVIVWPSQPNNFDAITPLIEMNGGTINAVYEKNVGVRIPLPNLIPLISADEVRAVRLPEIATSTDIAQSAAEAPLQQGGVTLPHTLALIGQSDWGTQSITGAGVKIAIIDSAGTHRNNVRDLIKDIAPGATITLYPSAGNVNVANMDTYIANARGANNKIIVIPMDLGANVSPGDGTGSAGSGQGDADDVYDEIQEAREAGILVIASAGNNTGSYVSFDYTVANTQIPMEIDQGNFIINVSWSDWNGAANLVSDISGTGITPQGSSARLDEPGYQYTGNCSLATCNITLDFNHVNTDTLNDYVQVQLATPGEINTAGITGSTVDAEAGNLARPADSPHALAVGAVCSDQGDRTVPRAMFPAMFDSSHGPIFNAGGDSSGPAIDLNTRADYKPDLVAPSHVYDPSTGDQATFDCHDSLEPTGGFNGTSASAAHVAGMAALLLSNSSMNSQIANANNPAAALQNYLQTHTIDLFNAASDGFGADVGFDNVYGAGMAVLGNPDYDLSQVSNPLPVGGNAIYVGLANPGSEQTGEFNKPYIHPAKAIQEAQDNLSISRIVFLPGEYTSGFIIEGRSDLDLESYNNRAEFWVVNNFEGQAGIHLETSTDISFDGFTFRGANLPPSNIISGGGEPYNYTRPVAIQFFSDGTPTSSGGSVIRNTTFTDFIDTVPLVIHQTLGVNIINSLFENINNSGGSSLNATAIRIFGATSDTEPTLLRSNTFKNLQGRVDTVSPAHETIIRIENSAVDLYSNFFLNNQADTVIGVHNSATDGTEAVNMFSNFFLNNRHVAVYLVNAPETRFVNNTVVGQTSTTSTRAIIRRDNSAEATPFAVYNNLFYNNGSGAFGYETVSAPGNVSKCFGLGSGEQTGVQHNWIINSSIEGACKPAIENIANENIVVSSAVDPITIFAGADPTYGLDPATEPFYYQPRSDADGIDLGDPTFLIPPDIDFVENDRNVDGDTSTTAEPDAGAFELVPLQAGPIFVNREEDIFDRANDRSTAFAIDLRNGVDGGVPPYTFKIKTYPENYSSDPSDFCLGNGLRIEGNFAFYCPPEHFYTDPVDAPDQLPDDVSFEYYAFDRTGDPTNNSTGSEGIATIEIAATVDQALNPATPINYNLIGEAGKVFRFRLRPFVRFNNFRFSEIGTPRNDQADYPFIYDTDITILDNDNPNIFDTTGFGTLEAYIENQLANPLPDGTVELDSVSGYRGFVEFTYNVSDSHNPVGNITNTVRIEVAGILPDKGLHDDSSFLFRYDTVDTSPDASNAWQPIASTGNINNTLHQTRRLDDVARFSFVGEGFVAYMQGKGSRNGSRWELRIDDPSGALPSLSWVQQADGSWRAARDGYTCRTEVSASGNLISNNSRDPYTVSCQGLRAGESHTVEFINRQARWLAIDAFSIMDEADPLLPGYHDVDEQQIIQMFPNWTQLSGRGPSNGAALVTTTDEIEDVVFTFSGSGVAIGTAIERFYDGSTASYVGADYDICITPQINVGGTTEVCQTFDNSTGAGRRPIYKVFRPFYGYTYDPLAPEPDVHQVRIHINNIPNNGRLLIDSITVFDQHPTGPLDLDARVNEDDVVGSIIFGNGSDDAWSLNTNNRRASNDSLTSLARRVVAAGPFIGFQIPDDADLIHWYRSAGRRDSTDLLVCVDRAQGEAIVGQHCMTYNLRTSENPLIIRESDFGGWGAANSDNLHTLEIFSLVNSPFNLDKIELFDNDQPLPEGFYEDYTLMANNGLFGLFDATGMMNGDDNFTLDQSRSARRASGSSFIETNILGEGALFQFTGTGFSAMFTKDRFSGGVEICWLENTTTTDVAAVAAGECTGILSNYSYRAAYQYEYIFTGLPQGNHTAIIRNVSDGVHTFTRMKLDGIEIYDDLLPSNILNESGQRYETNFINRAEEDTFLYYGNGWRTFEGRRARRYSGENYDYITGKIGATVMFQTQGVDTLRINRTARSGYANMQVCVDGADCVDIAGNVNPAIVRLDDLNAHVISITLTSGGRFYLDSIDVFDGTIPLGPGMYEDDEPLLRYLDGNWSNIGSRSYSARHGQRTNVDGAEMLFWMNGSIIEIGTYMRIYDQMEVCTEPGLTTDPGAVTDCETVQPNNGQSLGGRQTYFKDLVTAGDYTVVIRHNNPTGYTGNFLTVDYVYILDGVSPLIPGRYEDTHPVLMIAGQNGSWESATPRGSSDGSVLQTLVAGDYLEFRFDGTGFAIGTHTLPNGSEMLVCYVDDGSFDGTWDNSGSEQCIEFQNETPGSSKNITRSITGLPDDIYIVGVVNQDDGELDKFDPPVVRDALLNPPTLIVDFVEIYDGLPATLNTGGEYNQDAGDGSGNPFVQLLPEDRWGEISGRAARNATDGAYQSIVDSRNRVSRSYAGPSATFQIQAPADSISTLVLDTYADGRYTSNQFQVCIFSGATLVECNVLDTMPTNRYQVITIDNDPTGGVDPQATYTVSLQTLTPGYFRIDGFQLIQGTVLNAGRYEDLFIQIDGLIDAVGDAENWETKTNRAYTNGSIIQNQQADDFVQFEFDGTGFAIGTHIGRTGSEMDICFESMATFDTLWASDCSDPNVQKISFQNEAARVNRNITRSITGLPQGQYVVAVYHRDDQMSNLGATPVARNNVYYPATLIVDYVDIFDAQAPATITEVGTYEQNAVDGSAVPLIQLLPTDRWAEISGRAARGASGESYSGIIDGRGRVSSAYAGPTATMMLQAPANSTVTLVLNTYAAGRNHSSELQYCIMNGATLVAPCDVLATMPSNPNQVITINNTGNPETTYTVFFQTLTPGFFRIDTFQVIHGTILTEGIYDNHFMSDGGLIDLDGVWQFPPTRGTKVRRTYGGEIVRTQDDTAAVTFTFEGTGFSIITLEDARRLDIEVCIVSDTGFSGFPADCPDNAPSVGRGRFTQYGLSYYGLIPDTYHVQIRVIETPTSLLYEFFSLDAIAIFDDVTAAAALQPGVYDNTQLAADAAVRFAPEVFWTEYTRYRSGPPRGAWQQSDHRTAVNGAILQVFVEGNSLTLYQQISRRNSNNVRACLIVEGNTENELQCNNFSQSGRGGYFTPIMFYGLGEGTHEVIFENNQPGRNFNVDGLQVTP